MNPQRWRFRVISKSQLKYFRFQISGCTNSVYAAVPEIHCGKYSVERDIKQNASQHQHLLLFLPYKAEQRGDSRVF